MIHHLLGGVGSGARLRVGRVALAIARGERRADDAGGNRNHSHHSAVVQAHSAPRFTGSSSWGPFNNIRVDPAAPLTGTIMTNRDDHFRRLERMYLGAPANEYFKPDITIGEGTAEVTLAVRPDFFHAAHAVHGSVYFKVLDDATFFAASSLVRDVFVLTASFNLYFLRPISSGTMTARGVIVSRSARQLIGEGVIVDDNGKEIARGTGTFMPGRAKLDESLGYR